MGERADIRRAIADYMQSEGCGCCGDREAHKAHEATLAKMLGVKKYADGSGYDWSRYRTLTRAQQRRSEDV